VVAAVEASDVRELELRTTGLHIRLRRTGLLSSLAQSRPSVDDRGADDDLPAVRSPLTGIWYDAPAPGAPPYVRVGDTIEVGFVIGLVETMKVFNEVTADVSGVVRQIMVRRGELITSNAPILLLEPDASPDLPGDAS
jgi:biotin carboxyl carrier protein